MTASRTGDALKLTVKPRIKPSVEHGGSGRGLGLGTSTITRDTETPSSVRHTPDRPSQISPPSASASASAPSPSTSLDPADSDGKPPGHVLQLLGELGDLVEQRRFDHVITRFARFTRRGGQWNTDMLELVMGAIRESKIVDIPEYAANIMDMCPTYGIKPDGHTYAIYMDIVATKVSHEAARELWFNIFQYDDEYRQSIPILTTSMIVFAMDGPNHRINKKFFLQLMDYAIACEPHPVFFQNTLYWQFFIATTKTHGWDQELATYGKRLQSGGSHRSVIDDLNQQEQFSSLADDMLHDIQKAQIKVRELADKQQLMTEKLKVKKSVTS